MTFTTSRSRSSPGDESGALVASVLDYLSEGVILLTADGRPVHVNEAAVTLYGAANANDLRIQLADVARWFTYVGEDGLDLAPATWPLARVIRGESLRDEEFRLRRLDQPWERVLRYSSARLDHDATTPLLLVMLQDVTRCHTMTRALERHQIEMRTLFDLIPAMIWIKDTQNRQLQVNQRVADAAGMTVAEIEGRPASEIYPADADKYYADDLEVIRSRQPKLGIVERLRGPDGSTRWIQTDKVPYCDPAGNVAGILVVAHDITGRKDIEDALREERNRLRLLAETSPAVLHSFRLSPDGTMSFPYASARIREIYGLAPEDLAIDASMVSGLWHPDDHDRIKATIDQSLQGMTPWHQEFRVLHPLKGVVWVDGHSVPVRDADGVITWHGSLTDITERKLAEEEVQRRLELETRLSALASMLPGVMYAFTLDREGRQRFPFVTGRVTEIFGLDPAELRLDATPVMSRIHPDDIERVQQSILDSGRNLTVWSQVLRYEHPDRGTIWVEGRSTPTREPDGSARWYGILLDVSDRRRLEDQLRQAQKMEAIGQLAGGVAHDFNNLLTVILGNATLIAEGASDPDVADQAREMVAAAEHGSRLTRQLLLFSRKQVMRPRPMDLNEAVASMTSLLQRVLGEDVSLQAEFAPGLPAVLADAGMIEQVILNLAINARDAMPGGGRLIVSTASGTSGGDGHAMGTALTGPWVSLMVSDTGSGIPKAIQPRIFEPFFTTKEAGKGTGLGLATVYGIVTQHGGTISLDSLEGIGTTFRIHFPALLGDDSHMPGRPIASALPHGRETLLIVEDEPAVCRLTANVLRRCGYRVLTASSGSAALDVWRDHHDDIDLVVTDMVMPEGLSGPELGRRLRAERPGLRVIYTSGYSTETTAPAPELQPGVNFLQKPYQLSALAVTVRQCLDAPAVA